jgi:uncharacterized protein (TIGR02302 family)
MKTTQPPSALVRIVRPLRLTLWGLWAERLSRAFWPLWTILISALAALAFGLQDFLPIEAVWIGLVALVLGGGAAVWFGWRSFRGPTLDDAMLRLDSVLPGRPIAALTDDQAIGTADAASVAVWQAHRERMIAVAAKARAVAPDLRLSSRDPFGLRYMALTVLVMALLFGSLWRVASVAGLAPGAAQAVAVGPSWEGWAKPPPHTGKPALYLNDIPEGPLELPTGTEIQVRLYGEVGDLTLSETVSARLNPAPASEPAQEFQVLQSGAIRIEGNAGRVWQVTALPDGKPSVEITGELSRERDGQMKLPFSASDDHGIVAGAATIALDMPAIDRRYGLAVAPEAREPLVVDLPLPITGDRSEFTENLIEDMSEHPYANLPVVITLQASDAAGQTADSEPLKAVLPGRRFFDPLAAALIEMRRDILWSRVNAARVVQVMKAVTHLPQDLIRNENAYLRLRVALRRLEAQEDALTPELRDELAEAFWEIALLIEEGDLQSAMERLQRAQDRLDEAIRRGADKAEIDELMQELREAMDDYMRQLAEQQQRDPDMEMSQNMQRQEITGDQIQQMLDELQKLMEEGRMAEAQELMEALRQLMENLQVTEGQGGGQGGPGSPGQQGMRDLQDTLRDQQGLSDDAFRELQEGQQGQGQGQDQDQGQNDGGQPRERPGQGQGQGQPDRRSLADRQEELRDRLNGLNDNALPGQGTAEGEAGRRALEDSGRAMDEAERALRDGDIPGALDRQADAMESMREGLRNLGEALADDQRQGQAQEGEAFGRADPDSQRDPLGRELGEAGRIGSDRNLLQGEDVYRRAQNLLEEIRRRSGDQQRPSTERDYLRRLLDMF